MKKFVQIIIPSNQPYLSLLIDGIKMSFQKFENDSYCHRGRHRSATTKVHGIITSKGSKVINGYCSNCN